MDLNSISKKIHVVGLGPVGLATCWELLQKGHTVNGFDISEKRIQNLLSNEYDFPPQGQIDIQNFIKNEKLILRSHVDTPFDDNGNLIYLCVATPTLKNGIDLTQVQKALDQLVPRLQPHDHIVLRSTLQPGCTDQLIHQFQLNRFMITLYPEFLREKHVLDDIMHPPLKISCHNNQMAKNEFMSLHDNCSASIGNFKDIEMTKVACNLFHALKVTFANEILRSALANACDAHFVMDKIKSDHKLNISELYLNPGKAFAGHCLEKDLIAFLELNHKIKNQLPLVQSILESNNIHKSMNLA